MKMLLVLPALLLAIALCQGCDDKNTKQQNAVASNDFLNESLGIAHVSVEQANKDGSMTLKCEAGEFADNDERALALTTKNSLMLFHAENEPGLLVSVGNVQDDTFVVHPSKPAQFPKFAIGQKLSLVKTPLTYEIQPPKGQAFETATLTVEDASTIVTIISAGGEGSPKIIYRGPVKKGENRELKLWGTVLVSKANENAVVTVKFSNGASYGGRSQEGTPMNDFIFGAN